MSDFGVINRQLRLFHRKGGGPVQSNGGAYVLFETEARMAALAREVLPVFSGIEKYWYNLI